MPASTSDDCVEAYRLVAPKWAASALSGEGARLYGGRWNSPGRAMVYLSTSRALAALELRVFGAHRQVPVVKYWAYAHPQPPAFG